MPALVKKRDGGTAVPVKLRDVFARVVLHGVFQTAPLFVEFLKFFGAELCVIGVVG